MASESVTASSFRVPAFWPLFEEAIQQESHVAVFADHGFAPETLEGTYRPPLASMVLAWGANEVWTAEEGENPFTQPDLGRPWLGVWSYEQGWQAAAPRKTPTHATEPASPSFFSPKHVLYFNGAEWKYIGEDAGGPREWLAQTGWTEAPIQQETPRLNAEWQFPHATYMYKAKTLLEHIRRGDIYEINFCNRLQITSDIESGWEQWKRLVSISPMPFSCYIKTPELELVSASPERFFSLRQGLVFSQPMKGTIPRAGNPKDDKIAAETLKNNQKERSENIMICDLVRNDLSKVAEQGTVQARDVCQILPFKGVHQMISTVECKLKSGLSLHDVWTATFPMGSMTGAPKVRAMELIAELEEQPRGYFSGSAAYFIPELGFESNVIIRSMIRQGEGPWYIGVGSALTFDCVPEDEWQECQWKIAPFRRLFNLEISNDARSI